ncbi:uronyl 2-sulfotransferase-like [Ptychodera flava]|uniref:uronyl 2-sulfotransferase-like n=1 Tax=Ptychodera flava TaxID=63121 RepID=UPI00396A126A
METNRSNPGLRKRRCQLFSSYHTILLATVAISIIGLSSSCVRLRSRSNIAQQVLPRDDLVRKATFQFQKGAPKVTPETNLPVDVGRARSIDRLIYNRVGKCGSRTMLAVTEKTSHLNDFYLVKSQEFHGRTVSENEEAELVSEIMNITPPFLYNRHLDYINFEKHGIEDAPMYINLIRDPVERKISSFYYLRFGDVQRLRETTKRDTNVTFDECVLDMHDECSGGKITIIPYFCGQSDRCREDGEWALETAKRNVVEKYVFVGILEEFERSLRIFQYLMPQFFRSAPKAYKIIKRKNVMSKFKSVSRKESPETVKEIMRGRMQLDYEFYNFIKERMLLIEKQIVQNQHKIKKG